MNEHNTPYKLNQNSNGAEILLFIREDIPSCLIATENVTAKRFYLALNLRNEKYLINCSF